jgi:hypothetical protein
VNGWDIKQTDFVLANSQAGVGGIPEGYKVIADNANNV